MGSDCIIPDHCFSFLLWNQVDICFSLNNIFVGLFCEVMGKICQNVCQISQHRM